jgi:RNA polymerase sigma-70 factor (ECF subfamily)
LRELAAHALTAATENPSPVEAVETQDAVEAQEAVEADDDRLRLIFTCCHPALPLEARVALTLRTICAVPTADIARAFLVTESTMTRRLTRAKAKIADARIPYRVPTGPALTERLAGVLAVLYLLFTNGYNADGQPAFAKEAIRLARLRATLMPSQPETRALLALLLLQHSRRDARRDADGNLLNLERQDRSRWDHAAIAEATAIMAELPLDGPYGLQARIAACHAAAASTEDTDWRQIADCYDTLSQLHTSPVIELNRAVAHGYVYGAAAGLALLARARAGGALDDYPSCHRGRSPPIARHGGDHERAAELFRQAAARTHSESERRALLDRAAETV